MWSLFCEISVRHVKHAPFRSALVVLGIALGVSMLSAVISTNESLLSAFEDMVERVAGQADLSVTAGTSGVSGALTAEIAALEGVAHAAAMLEVTTQIIDDRERTSLLVLGVDFLGDTFFLPFAEDSERGVVQDPLAFVNDPRALLVSRTLARARGLSLGSPLTLLTPEGPTTFHVRGLLEDQGPAASFGGQVAVMFLDALQVSFGRGERVDRIDIVVDEGHALTDVQERVRALVAGQAEVEPPSHRGTQLMSTLWAFRNGLRASGLAALWVGMFLIYNAVSISIAQRRREVGILRALGVTRRGITALFCLEALAMALIGSAVGLALGGALATLALESTASHINRFVLPMHPPAPRITLDIALSATTSALIATVLAAYFPARKSARIDPAESLRASRTSAFRRRTSEYRLAAIGLTVVLGACVSASAGGELNGYLASTATVSGLALLVPLSVRAMRRGVLGLVERICGITGRLALDNVERALGRSSVTVVAMMLAVSMSMTIGSYAKAFEESVLDWANAAFAADAIVTAGSPMHDRQHIPFAPTALQKLQGVPGIARINTNRIAHAHDAEGRTFQINAKDTQMQLQELRRLGRRERVLAGPDPLQETALVEAPRVILSENLARATGLSVGDSIDINTPSGAQRFAVYAVVVDYSSDRGALFMDQKWYRQFFRDEQIDSMDLFFAPGAVPEEVVARVRSRLGGGDALFVTLEEGLREQLRQVAGNVFALTRAPELVTLVVALLGVAGTMLAAVIDRLRELGLLRAIGATRRQVLASVIAEAGFLGVAATVCGIAAGIPQGFIFLKVIGIATSGWNLPYSFPLETALRTGSLMIAAATLAGLLPAIRGARLEVRDALAYE